MKKKIVEWKFQKELTFQQILKTLLIIYLHPFLFHSLYFYPTLHPNKVLIWSWRLCGSDIDMTKKKKVWYKYFWHPFMRLLVLSWLSVFSCDLYVSCLILLTLFRSHILLRVLLPIWKWFHLLKDNTGKILSWSILSNRDSSQVYSKTKSMVWLATTFHSHWVLMACEISLAFVVFLNLN